jgi:uncharacterized protein YdaU (DUF1376 family)
MHYYKRNLGDYAKKAGRLSILQHGVYTLLLDACYDRERFPTRDEAIEWTWAGSQAEIEAVDFVLSRFFVLEDGRFVQLRVREELAEYHAKAEKNAEIAKAREEKKRNKTVNANERTDHEPANNQNEPFTNRAPDVQKSQPNHKPLTNNHKPQEAAASLIEESDRAAANSVGHSPTQAGMIAAELRKRGVAVTSQQQTLLKWISDGVTLPALIEATDIAVKRKKAKNDTTQIRAGYIDAIVRDPQFGKEAKPADRWWTTQKGIDKKAAELGIKPRSTETYDELKDRLFTVIREGANV